MLTLALHPLLHAHDAAAQVWTGATCPARHSCQRLDASTWRCLAGNATRSGGANASAPAAAAVPLARQAPAPAAPAPVGRNGSTPAGNGPNSTIGVSSMPGGLSSGSFETTLDSSSANNSNLLAPLNEITLPSPTPSPPAPAAAPSPPPPPASSGAAVLAWQQAAQQLLLSAAAALACTAVV